MVRNIRLPWWKRMLFLITPTCLTGVLALAALEVYLRVVVERNFQAETEQLLVPSSVPGLGYQLAPNFDKEWYRTDARSLRWRPPDDPPPARTILLLGDSVAFAGGVPEEESFAHLLEASLSRRLGQKVALWNGGVPGYNTRQEALLLEHLGPAVGPDLVIVQFCMNDYLDPPALTGRGALDATRVDPQSGVSLLSLLYSSRALFFLKEKFKDLQKTHPEWFPAWAHYIHYTHKRAGWQNVKAALLRMQATAARLDTQLLVVLFPVEQQLRIPERDPQDDLWRFGRANGINVLDLHEPFRLRWRDGLYFDYSVQAHVVDKVHLSARGHALAAEQIAGEILQHRDRYLPERRD